jgi:hypothetical protein
MLYQGSNSAIKRFAFLLIFLLAGVASCKQQQPVTPAIKIKPADSHRSVAITGLDPIILNDIDRDSVKNWQSLFAIYRLPADTDMRDYQPIQPGRYQLKESVLLFTPDTPFVKDQLYFVRYYNHAVSKTIWDYLKGKTSKGQLHYTDLIFKP